MVNNAGFKRIISYFEISGYIWRHSHIEPWLGLDPGCVSRIEKINSNQSLGVESTATFECPRQTLRIALRAPSIHRDRFATESY